MNKEQLKRISDVTGTTLWKSGVILSTAACCFWATWSDAEISTSQPKPAPVIAPVSVKVAALSQAAPAPALAERSAVLNSPAVHEPVLAPAVGASSAASVPASVAQSAVSVAASVAPTSVPSASSSGPVADAAPAAHVPVPVRAAASARAAVATVRHVPSAVPAPRPLTLAAAELTADKRPLKESEREKESVKETKEKGRDKEGGFSVGKGEAPVRIDADRLEVDRKSGVAVFSGNVSARQGDMTLTGARMNVYYAEKGASTGENAGKTPGVKRIEITGGVRVTNGKEEARGDRGVYDAEKRTVTLEGADLQLQSGGNSIRGKRLVYDVVTGKSRMEGGASGGGRVTGIFRPGDHQPKED